MLKAIKKMIRKPRPKALSNKERKKWEKLAQVLNGGGY